VKQLAGVCAGAPALLSLELPVRAGWAAAAASAAPDAAQTGGAGGGQRSPTQVTKGGARGLIGGCPGAAVTSAPCACVVLRVPMRQGPSKLAVSRVLCQVAVWDCRPGQADMACGQ
jgi:hypothetical protein